MSFSSGQTRPPELSTGRCHERISLRGLPHFERLAGRHIQPLAYQGDRPRLRQKAVARFPGETMGCLNWRTDALRLRRHGTQR